MPGRMPREEDSFLQLHRVAELHRLVEARRGRQEPLDADRDRERSSLYRSALLHLSGAASRYSIRDVQVGDDEPSDAEPPSSTMDAADEQYWDLHAQDLKPAQPCTFLRAGQKYSGRQRVTRALRLASSAVPEEHWGVEVQIQEVDLDRGYLCGCMRADDVRQTKRPVVTFWEGEILDNRNASFLTTKWGADLPTDLKHWSKFPAFTALQSEVKSRRGRCRGLSSYRYIFMRWKEQFFLDAEDDCGLTIQGFYYICMSRETGAITGFYFDPSCTPCQKLELEPRRFASTGGLTFGHYTLNN